MKKICGIMCLLAFFIGCFAAKKIPIAENEPWEISYTEEELLYFAAEYLLATGQATEEDVGGWALFTDEAHKEHHARLVEIYSRFGATAVVLYARYEFVEQTEGERADLTNRSPVLLVDIEGLDATIAEKFAEHIGTTVEDLLRIPQARTLRILAKYGLDVAEQYHRTGRLPESELSCVKNKFISVGNVPLPWFRSIQAKCTPVTLPTNSPLQTLFNNQTIEEK